MTFFCGSFAQEIWTLSCGGPCKEVIFVQPEEAEGETALSGLSLSIVVCTGQDAELLLLGPIPKFGALMSRTLKASVKH